jgi:hypothetical protein
LIELATNEVLYKNTINRFQFDSLILEDGGSMSTKSASGIKCGTITNMHWNPDAAGCFCRAPYGAHAACSLDQFCIDGTCVSDNVLGSSAVVTSTTMRIGATTTLGNEVASSLVVNGMLDLTCATMAVTSSGKIAGNGKGFSEEEGPGFLFDTTILEYPSPTYGKPGGSHGGIAGMQGRLKFGEQGSCYGSLKSPVTMGSGGKRGVTGAGVFGMGGFGGSAIKITATTSLLLDGSISVDGTEGSKPNVATYSDHQAGAGGAGGSVYITAPTFSGGGTITSDGGMSTKGGGTRNGLQLCSRSS